MKTFMGGIGLLARNLNVPVVPARIEGLYELKKRGAHVALRGQITVSIGDPVTFSDGEEPAAIATELRRRVAGL
jgi:long-chain acyl-CoA synthetase